MCPPGDGLCGRVTFMQNGVQKVMEDCSLRKFCIGNIDCLKDGFELGKRFKNATNCVVSCCEGENCNPPAPLKCFQCQGKGIYGYLFSIFTDLDRRKNPLLG